MPKNKVFVSVFVDNVADWRFIDLKATCAVSDDNGTTLHLKTTTDLRAFAEKLMELYDASKPQPSVS